MGGNSLGIIVEVLVAGLLAVTIGYCVIVNRKLEGLRSDKSDLRAIIRDLYAATGHAEKAIGALRVNAVSLEQNLGEQIERARKSGKHLSHEVDRGEALLSKLAVIAKNNQGRAEPPRQHAPRQAAPLSVASPPATARAGRLGLGLLSQKPEMATHGDSLLQPVAGKDAA